MRARFHDRTTPSCAASTGIPILNLTIDSQSGTAGVETRIESFVDILRYQQTGGYLK